MTVQALELLGPRLVGLHAREERAEEAGAIRLSVALWEVPLMVAVTVAVALLPMAPAVALNIPVDDPAVIMAADGTVKPGLLLASITALQPEATGPFKMMVHALTVFEVKLAGLQATDDTARPVARLIVTFRGTPFKVAVTITA